MSEALLSAQGLSVWRGEEFLFDALDAEVRPGEAVQIRGANGSGKTTLIRVLCGLVTADQGEVFWRGKPLHQVREAFHASVRYLGHKPGLSLALNPAENLLLHASLSGRAQPHAAFIARRDEALAALAIDHRLEVPLGALSAGQQRRVALARLMLEPVPLWVLDEPLNALDVHGMDWVRKRMIEQVRRGGAVLFSTHQTIDLGGVAHRAIVLDEEAAA